MSIFAEIARIRAELIRVGNQEGLEPVELTGEYRVDHESELCWFVVQDPASGTIAYVTPDAPGAAAPGETLVAAASWDEAENLGSQIAP